MGVLRVKGKVVRERLRWSLFSSYFHAVGAIAAGTTDTLFATPKGAAGQGFAAALTLRETNMMAAGQLPRDHKFYAMGLRLVVLETTPLADLNGLKDACSLEVRTVSKNQLEIPLCIVPAGCGTVAMVVNTSGAAVVTQVNNGWPVSSNVYQLRPLPIKFDAIETFAVDVVWRAGYTVTAATLTYRIVFDGILTRPAQ
jgi:hypothetical protein